MKVLLFVIACTLPALLSANPLSDKESASSFKDTLTSFLRVRRQSPATCSSDRDCFADPETDAPQTLVQCVGDECVCSDCFMLNSAGRCSSTLCPDYSYSNTSQECGIDRRPSQLTAFLLSLFVSSTGAANFFIGQGSLGGGQIALLLITLIFSYAMCCFPCCLACCMEDVKGSIVFILLMLISSILVIVASLAISAWWIADLIIFATNQRLAGNGCMLSPWN